MKFKQPWYFQADPEDIGGGGDPGPNDPPSDPPASKWPDDWRQLYAGEDEKKLSHLSRYASPEAAFDGLIATKSKLSSGEYKSTAPFPEKGSEEEQNAWREQNGIPLKPEEYIFENIPEEDKEYIEDFQKYAHEQNIPKSQADAFVQFLLKQEEVSSESEKQLDEQLKADAEDKLRLEWGADYRRNLNVISGLFDSAPDGVKDAIFGGRLADGTPFGSSPDVLRFMADLALQINPMATVVNVSGGSIANSIEDEIKSIESKMNTDEYFKDEDMQKRLRDLYTARERMK